MVNKTQQYILDIYKQVAKICERHRLRYFAIGGTCIGAVRHHGFIPWDDDMDIAMPIEDFNMFREIIKTELPSYLTVMDPGVAKHDYLEYLKVMDARTMMTEPTFLRWPDTYEGVWLDIMPLGGIPNSGINRKKYLRKLKRYTRFNYKLRTDINMQKSLTGKLFGSVVHLFRPFIDYQYFWKRWLKHVSQYSFSDSQYTGYIWSKRVDKLIFSTEWFGDYVEMPFEDTTIRMPVGWDAMLTQMFGDYMELPPTEKQQSNHEIDEGIVDFTTSYQAYQSKNK
ncbi:LicD family protein [Lactiplantibacillus paraplantarum]|uniref:LicD family protein n=1 Tax=Lactiplantibacillus paraplantarum TaxID=60520 RepID=UPI003B28801F